MKKTLWFVWVILSVPGAAAQPGRYSVSNAHSHNDYEQAHPFWTAYAAGFGSIEADIFLLKGRLYVAHDTQELRQHILLEEEYLNPLQSCLRNNAGYPFRDSARKLQMLIDIKTDSLQTLDELMRVLKNYPQLIEGKSLTWVITGSRPAAAYLVRYPLYILFDGDFRLLYVAEDMEKVALFSDNFKNYSQWNGTGTLPAKDAAALQAAILIAHDHHKPVRFWNAPDNETAWKTLIRLGVDFINTDHIAELASFLREEL